MAPPRRSARLKRAKAPQSEPNFDESRAKRLKGRTVESKTTVQRRALTTSCPSEYQPCNQTVFLREDFQTLHWNITQPAGAKTFKLEDVLNNHGNNTHRYFCSTAAANHAASRKAFMYRHIGSIVMENLQKLSTASPDDFGTVFEGAEDLVNLVHTLQASRFENEKLLATLRSLTNPEQGTWDCPFIVIVAKRKDVVRACHGDVKSSCNVVAQVYIGRLLFELIACEEIKILFEALNPSIPYVAVAQLPKYPQTFTRSQSASRESSRSFSAILRNAESLGYASLTQQQREKVRKDVNVKLYLYQEQTVRWMLDRENGPHALNDFFWEERSFTNTGKAGGGKFYYFPLTGEVRLRKPPRIRGGMVAEEMGLGKTVEALALIAAQKTEHKPNEINIWCETNPSDLHVHEGTVCLRRLRKRNRDAETPSSLFYHGDEVLDDAPDRDWPKTVKVRRWPPKTTLVVCPSGLVGQWKQEAIRRAPSLSIEVWQSPSNSDPGTDSSVAIGEHARDIVLASYETIRNDPELSKICWRRLILDEAQMTRRNTTQIASDVFNLRTETRFLMTGTPIVNSINDLKGELAMLKVWPFTLDEDGFWEEHVLYPFRCGRGVPLVASLLNVTMMRHTKGQDLGISLPPRLYRTIEVDLVGSHRAVYCYVLGCCLDELEAQNPDNVDTRQLRILLRMLVAICLSPSLLELTFLDLAKRATWTRRLSHGFRFARRADGSRQSLQKVSAKDAIEFVAENATHIVRDSARSFATDHAHVANELDRYLRMPLDALRQEVIAKGIIEESRTVRLRKERLAALAAGGVHRLATDTLAELRETATRVGIISPEQAGSLSRAAAMAKLQMHYDVMKGIDATRAVHRSGFAAITKLMEGKGNPGCPVCLTECDERLAVTKCGHIYCLDCVFLMLENSDGASRCAICRRDLSLDGIVEILRPSKSQDDETKQENAPVIETEAGLVAPSVLASKHHNVQPVAQRGDALIAGSKLLPHSASDHRDMSKPKARDAWSEYNQLGVAPSRFGSLGRNPEFPSLEASFLRHLAAATCGLESPKLTALLSLIRSCPQETKFCVVASSVLNLRTIHNFLESNDIRCVESGVPGKGRRASGIASVSRDFSSNPEVRVFLLNPANASGLTLIAAEYVIFMETLVRVADEVQAAARVHRIGQSKTVKVIRIVARNTIEEHIIWQRGEIRSVQEESEALSAVNNKDASDRVILRLLRDDGGSERRNGELQLRLRP